MTTIISNGYGKTGPASDMPHYPEYIEDQHAAWLVGGGGYPYNIKAYLDAAFALTAASGSPYYNATVYDPETDLDEIEERLTDYLSSVDALDPVTDFNSAVTAAAAKKAQFVPDNTAIESALTAYNDGEVEDAIDDAVAAFDATETDALNASLNQFCGSMFEARASQTSQFVQGLFQIQAQHRRRVADMRMQLTAQAKQRAADYRAQLTMNVKRTETAYMMQAVQDIERLVYSIADHQFRAHSAKSEFGRMKIVAMNEFDENNLRMEVEDAQWELSLFDFGNKALAAPAGLATSTPKLNKGQNALATMLGGAGVALTAGSMTGSVAVGVGAAALLGALGWMTGG